MLCSHTGYGDAGSPDGEDLIDAVVLEDPKLRQSHLTEQHPVDGSKTVHLQHVAGANLTFFQNTLFQKFHLPLTLSKHNPFFFFPYYDKFHEFCNIFDLMDGGYFLLREFLWSA